MVFLEFLFWLFVLCFQMGKEDHQWGCFTSLLLFFFFVLIVSQIF